MSDLTEADRLEMLAIAGEVRASAECLMEAPAVVGELRVHAAYIVGRADELKSMLSHGDDTYDDVVRDGLAAGVRGGNQ